MPRKTTTELVPVELIEHRIHIIRGQRVMLDSDLADLYGVPTKVLKQSVKRNDDRFPDDFAFELTQQEFANLRSQIVTSNEGREGRRYVLTQMMEPVPQPAKKGRIGFQPPTETQTD